MSSYVKITLLVLICGILLTLLSSFKSTQTPYFCIGDVAHPSNIYRSGYPAPYYDMNCSSSDQMPDGLGDPHAGFRLSTFAADVLFWSAASLALFGVYKNAVRSEKRK